MASSDFRELLNRGVVIPAHPLALNSQRRLDERHQRALTRYYLAAGAGGLAIGVHTTQFAIRDPKVGLFQPVLALVAEEMDRSDELWFASPASAVPRSRQWLRPKSQSNLATMPAC